MKLCINCKHSTQAKPQVVNGRVLFPFVDTIKPLPMSLLYCTKVQQMNCEIYGDDRPVKCSTARNDNSACGQSAILYEGKN